MEQSQPEARRISAVGTFVKTLLFMLLAGIVGPAFIVISFFVEEPWLLPVGIGVTALDVIIAIVISSFTVRRRRRIERLERTGIRGMAEVLSLTETNVTINDRPVLVIRMWVTGVGVQPFEVEKRVSVSMLQMSMMHSGRLAVLIDPESKDVEIDWQGSASIGGLGTPAPAHMMHMPDGSVHPVGDGAQLNAVVDILRSHGLPTDGQIDLRQHPSVREEVLRVMGFDPSQVDARGVGAGGDASVSAAAAQAAARAPKRTAVERMRDLDDLRQAGAISDEEHAAARRRVLDEI